MASIETTSNDMEVSAHLEERNAPVCVHRGAHATKESLGLWSGCAGILSSTQDIKNE